MKPEKPEIPYVSPLVPQLLGLEDTIQFSCYQGISCFNACCRQADITLTPYDILRFKKRLELTSTEFLAQYTVPFEMDADGLPGVKLRTQNQAPVCLFMNESGCSVYQDRPAACRYYPVGMMAMRAMGSAEDKAQYCLVREDHCKGHEEPCTLTIAAYRKEQQVEEFDDINRDWFRVILKKRSAGPAVGKLSDTSLHMFFMCSYDIDKFRVFIKSDGFKSIYDLDETTSRGLEEDDISLLQFGFRLMRQVFYGEQTIAHREGALEKRIAERKDIIEMKRQVEIVKAHHEDARYDSGDAEKVDD